MVFHDLMSPTGRGKQRYAHFIYLAKRKTVFRWIVLLLDDPSPTRRERRAHFIQLIDLFRPSHSPVLITIPSILGNKLIIFLFFN